MPYFYFDLVVGEEFKDQGGMILEDTQIAFEKADSLASELYIVRPDLRSRGCAVRLTDGENKELYRTPLDPIPRSAIACTSTRCYMPMWGNATDAQQNSGTSSKNISTHIHQKKGVPEKKADLRIILQQPPR